MPTCDIAIIGAGPYGLSAAAHLHSYKGLDVRVFGEPMAFWQKNMPKGMFLRSPWAGTHLSDPLHSLTLDNYHGTSGASVSGPLPLERFVEYGRWFQNQAAPELDRMKVELVHREGRGFRLRLADATFWRARRVIVAAGILPFAFRPLAFKALPSTHASHSSEHCALACFSGKRVAVIGGGQSALESAALLHEAGAEVEVLVRAPMVRWLWNRPYLHTYRPIAALLYAPPDVGPAGVSHLVARPNWFRRLPRRAQISLSARSVRPAGAAWLKPRCSSFAISTNCTVTSARVVRGQASLKLSDGSERYVDHVLLATGYRVDISHYPFLSPELLSRITRSSGYPLLDAGFESSVAGLHFLGAPAAWSFGPLMRFLAGTNFASRAVTRKIMSSPASVELARRQLTPRSSRKHVLTGASSTSCQLQPPFRSKLPV
jgi:cation diffusion facilitator CzcD-associated flavoprotein CzcO